jgi:hypothetical protein
MKPLLVILSLIALTLPAMERQSGTGCGVINIPAGAITNGESMSLAEKQTRAAGPDSEDPGMRAIIQQIADTRKAAAFYNRVSTTPDMQGDETL